MKDKIAVVTGAGSGIGKATALKLAMAGAKVGLLGRTESDLKKVAKTIAEAGGEAIVLLADISNGNQMRHAMEQVEERWGRLDILFANAGINGMWAPIEELTVDEWDQTISVNLRGTFLTLKYAIPLLKIAGGSVIITASVNGTRMFSNAGATAYSCTKAAQVALAKMAAVELGQYRIRVNVICPGSIETDIEENTARRNLDSIRVPVEYPEGRIPLTGGEPGKAEQVADLAIFLGSDAASHISGTELWIDGAESLVRG